MFQINRDFIISRRSIFSCLLFFVAVLQICTKPAVAAWNGYDKYIGYSKDELISSLDPNLYDKENQTKNSGKLAVTIGKKKTYLPYDETVTEDPGANWQRTYYLKQGNVIAVEYGGISFLGSRKDADNLVANYIKEHQKHGYKLLKKSGSKSAELKKDKIYFTINAGDKYGDDATMWKVENRYVYFLMQQ